MIYAFLGGIIFTTATTILLSKRPEEAPPPPVVVESKIAEKLTDVELLEKPCSEKYIESHGDGLCREMFCLMMTRGIDSETSGSQCEQIANINNTLMILKACSFSEEDSEEKREDCVQVFRERK